ncbi:hypothetical protein [Rubinisphaera sp.]|uniref:hypothetical protein n=1 Tax=Rubinisphaera sp. TaxID=2024857 RepID=UPI000C0E3F12|nr:hypothetical protein [Rubinisphaera sp.]MBV08090.1 hypothetical protein [Rubinisphaera sp.]HCS55364.1 hypothetical protein [Planctomycetaceae bacterium]|tara:strand:+ start:55 stop:960 length:906 start_codon:yes stop_codon:yes gene_type:complete
MKLHRSCIWGVVLAVILQAQSVQGQDPGVTKPTLEALVANSSEILTVKVKSFQVEEPRQKVMQLELMPTSSIKRAWKLPEDQTEASRLVYEKEDAEQVRAYDQYYWSYDLSSPGGRLAAQLPDWKKNQTEFLLFKDFQSPNSGPLQFLISIDDDSVYRNDWSAISGREEILKRIRELMKTYQGVEKVKLVLVDVGHFGSTFPKNQEGKIDHSIPEARCIIQPFDNDYEKLLVSQIKDLKKLRDNSFTTTRIDWLKYTQDFYHFQSPENEKLLQEAYSDPQIGEQQKALLKKMLDAWGVNIE